MSSPFQNFLKKIGLKKDKTNNQNLAKISNAFGKPNSNPNWKNVKGQIKGQNNNIQIHLKNNQITGKGVGKIAQIQGSALITLAQNIQNLEYIALQITATVKSGQVRISILKPDGQIAWSVNKKDSQTNSPEIIKLSDFAMLDFGMLKFKVEALSPTASDIEYMVEIG